MQPGVVPKGVTAENCVPKRPREARPREARPCWGLQSGAAGAALFPCVPFPSSELLRGAPSSPKDLLRKHYGNAIELASLRGAPSSPKDLLRKHYGNAIELASQVNEELYGA